MSYTNIRALSVHLATLVTPRGIGKRDSKNTRTILHALGNNLSGMQIFAPMQHTSKAEGKCGHVPREDFEFIGGDGGRYLLQIKESLFIKKYNPELNGSETSVPLHLF